MASLLVRGGRFVDPSQNIDRVASLLLREGVVVAIDPPDVHADEVIDATGMIVSPGLVDMHVHLREPGRKKTKPSKPALPQRSLEDLRRLLAFPTLSLLSILRAQLNLFIRRLYGPITAMCLSSDASAETGRERSSRRLAS